MYRLELLRRVAQFKQTNYSGTQKTNCLEHLFVEPAKQERERHGMEFRLTLALNNGLLGHGIEKFTAKHDVSHEKLKLQRWIKSESRYNMDAMHFRSNHKTWLLALFTLHVYWAQTHLATFSLKRSRKVLYKASNHGSCQLLLTLNHLL